MALLKQLVIQAGERISIIPGAGVRSGNIEALVSQTGAREYHTSARKVQDNPMSYSNPLVSDAGNHYVADEKELERIIRILQK